MSALAADTPRRGDCVLVTLWDGRVTSARVKRVVLMKHHTATTSGQRIPLNPQRFYVLDGAPMLSHGLIREGVMGIRRIRRVPVPVPERRPAFYAIRNAQGEIHHSLRNVSPSSVFRAHEWAGILTRSDNPAIRAAGPYTVTEEN